MGAAPDAVPPRGLPRGLVVLLGTSAVVVTCAGIKSMAWLIGPVFLAWTIVVAVSPLQGWLRRHGCPRWVATPVLVLVVYAILLSLFFTLVVSVARLASLLPQYAARADELLGRIGDRLAAFGVDQSQVDDVLGSLDLGKLAGLLGAVLEGVAGLVSSLVFLLSLLLFLSLEANAGHARMATIADERPLIASSLRGFIRGTRRYLVVSTVFGLVVAALDTVALVVLGIPLPILWGLLAFITNYVPNIGFVLGVIPPALLGLLEGGWQTMLAVIVVYSVLNFVVQSLVQPRFVGGAVGLSTTVAFLSLLFWAWLLGPVGAVLAVPLTLLAKALLVDVDPRAKWAGALLGLQRPTS
ncbi:MAG: AI-2E family transporter [Saccharothrix sp.]|nr:AI-2E family transporter [Saccharothrix sp.]